MVKFIFVVLWDVIKALFLTFSVTLIVVGVRMVSGI
jgi:hypothetical protein